MTSLVNHLNKRQYYTAAQNYYVAYGASHVWKVIRSDIYWGVNQGIIVMGWEWAWQNGVRQND